MMGEHSVDRMEKKKMPVRIIWALAFAAVLALALFLIFGGWEMISGGGKTYTIEKSGVSAEINADSETMIVPMGNLVLRSNRSGMRALAPDGSVRWDVAYAMNSPYLLVVGEYAAVADLAGRQAVIVGVSGNEVEITAEGTILFHAVNEEGKVVLVVSSETGHTLLLYSAEGELMLRRQTYSDKDGIPLAVALSEDGSRMVTSYVSYTGNKLTCSLTVFDLSSGGSGLVDRVLGSLLTEGLLVTDLCYIGGYCVYIGDNQIGALDTEKGCVEKWNKKLEYQLEKIAFGENTFALGLGEGMAGGGASAKKDFLIYKANGEILFEAELGGVSGLSASAGGYVYNSGRRYTAVDEKGNTLWTAEPEAAYRKMMLLADPASVAAQTNEEIVFFNRVAIEEKE